jgi:hypothetical protein
LPMRRHVRAARPETADALVRAPGVTHARASIPGIWHRPSD